jgi:hypothetical protein
MKSMTSNFLGGAIQTPHSPIISASELLAREGVNLSKGMNFRDSGNMLSVFLVLPTHNAEFSDEWHEDTLTYVYEGHDSTTVKNGREADQLLMYEDGRVTDNGKFYKAAHAFKDGLRKDPLQIQIYEKLDPGVWYDKGIFNLVDAVSIKKLGRKVYAFHLVPAEAFETGAMTNEDETECMLSATAKATLWKRGMGRCTVCGQQSLLNFYRAKQHYELRCETHGSGALGKGLLG